MANMVFKNSNEAGTFVYRTCDFATGESLEITSTQLGCHAYTTAVTSINSISVSNKIMDIVINYLRLRLRLRLKYEVIFLHIVLSILLLFKPVQKEKVVY